MKHDQIIAEYIKREGIKRFAEIGIFRSYFMTSLLEEVGSQLDEYWAVDPWLRDIGAKTIGQHRNHPQEMWDGWYIKACRRMIFWPQLRVLRMFSVKAASLFPKNYFDMVYLDAAHDYTSLVQDSEAWLPKVKAGGFIGGHDYGHKKFPGVKIAVDRMFGNNVRLHSHYVWVSSKTGKSG